MDYQYVTYVTLYCDTILWQVVWINVWWDAFEDTFFWSNLKINGSNIIMLHLKNICNIVEYYCWLICRCTYSWTMMYNTKVYNLHMCCQDGHYRGGGGRDSGVAISQIPDFLGFYSLIPDFLGLYSPIPDFWGLYSQIPDFRPLRPVPTFSRPINMF